MTIEIKNEANKMTVLLKGRLDNAEISNFSEKIEPLTKNAVKHVVFDCSGLQFVSLSGLRLFSSLQETFKRKGGNFYLSNVAATIMQIITVTGFATLLSLK